MRRCMRFPFRIVFCLALLSTAAYGQIPNAGDQGRAAGLIYRIAHGDAKEQEVAEQALFAIGGPTLPHLVAARARRDVDVREPADRLIDGIKNSSSRTAGTTFARIEPGEFSMGSPEDEERRGEDEVQHDVRITRPFLIATREVTQDEYGNVMGVQPSWFAPTGDGYASMGALFATGWFPVDSVSWYDAIEYCNRLSELDGLDAYYAISEVRRDGESIVDADVAIIGGDGYRLPTEAEWEYACRAGTKTPFHFEDVTHGGNYQHSAPAGVYGQGWHNAKRTTTVANYKPNALGLFDMHGNAAEWVWDWHSADYYRDSKGEDPTGPQCGSARVLRGGTFYMHSFGCRSAARLSAAPGAREHTIGFRIARDAPADVEDER